MQYSGMGGEMPFQGIAGQSLQAGGLGGERPVLRPGTGMQETGHHRGVSQGYGPERRQGKDHRRVPSGLRQQVQPQGRPQEYDHEQPLGRDPMGMQQQEMRRQMPREASRQPQGDVQGTTRNFVDDVKQQNPAAVTWQAQHFLHLEQLVRGRCSTLCAWTSVCVAGAAL